MKNDGFIKVTVVEGGGKIVMEITVWKRLDEKTQEFDHNHIENGHVSGNYPKPKGDFDVQIKKLA